MSEKSVKKEQIRKEIVEKYQLGASIEELMVEYGKSKKQVVGILVYEGVYNKSKIKSERDKMIKEITAISMHLTVADFKRIPIKFLQELLKDYKYFEQEINNLREECGIKVRTEE